MLSSRELLRRNPAFRRLFLASVVSLAGDWFSFVAVADLVTELTGRPGAAAFTYAAMVLPGFLASPIAGTTADRFDRRRVLVIADLARVPIALLLCVAAWWHSVPLAIGAIIGLGIGSSFYDPAASAATPNLVDPEELATAQTLMAAVWGSMVLVGAGLGGLVSEILGRQTAFAIDAASFVVSAWLVAGIRRPMQEVRVETSGGLGEAIRYARSSPLVTRLRPAFARGRFAGTGIATGLLFAARGLGAVLGPVLARHAAGGAPSMRAIVAICGVSTLTYGAVYAALPVTPILALALILVVLAHLGGGAQWALSTYGLQTATPDRLRGRILSLDYGLATLAIGISAIVAGLLANAYGEATSTWLLAAFAGVYGVAWLAWSAGVAPRA